jgi:3-hydroxyacyl-CoA dehydrogenase
MRIVRVGTGLAALVLSAHMLAAQQPAPPHQPDTLAGGMAGMPGMAAQMQMMDSLNARLDTLVSRMNRATGNRKVTAMAEVINELVAQRKVMQERMHQMMESREGMMHGMGEPAPAGRPAPAPRPDSAPADTAGHGGHHPPS